MLVFSTFFGGNGRYGTLREIAFDSAGNIVATGYGPHFTPSDFPTATIIGPGGGGSDIPIVKFTPDGKVLWVTIIGGSGFEKGYGIATDVNDNIYIAGGTGSQDFPTTAGSWDRTNNGGTTEKCPGPPICNMDACVLKLSADGKNLIYSTFLGGSGNDGARGGLAVDNQGCAYVVGHTSSRDFLDEGGIANPQKVNRYLGGDVDAFVAKVSRDGSSIIYARYLGGSKGSDVTMGVQVDADGHAFVNVIVRSDDAFTTPNAFDRTFNGGQSDSYFARLSTDGKQLLYATYFGGSGDEWAEHRMALDKSGNAYLVGFTASADFPTINAYRSKIAGPGDGYLVKLNPSGQPVFSTYLGGSRSDVSSGPFLDADDNILVAGLTESSDLEVTNGAYDTTYNGGKSDAFLQIYDPQGRLSYSTFLGGKKGDGARYVAVDVDGNPIVIGSSKSPDFPTSPTAYDQLHSGGDDGFITKFDRSKMH
jgi:hypothetical protein